MEKSEYVKIGKYRQILADFWQMTLILIETRYGGAITVWRGGAFLILGGYSSLPKEEERLYGIMCLGKIIFC